MRSFSPKAFTLVEIMIVVVIIGLLAALAVPAFRRVKLRANATRVANDLKKFAAAFEQYNFAHGAWPPDDSAQSVPLGMEGELPSAWSALAPGGHQYDWDVGMSGVAAAISLRPAGGRTDDELFAQVDRILDDGDTSTGTFRLVGDRFMYVLQP